MPSSTSRRCRDEFNGLKVGPSTESHSARMQHLVHKGCIPGCYHSLTIPEFCPKDGHHFTKARVPNGAEWMEYVWNLHEFVISCGLIRLMACPTSFQAGLIPSPPGPGHYTRIGLAAVAVPWAQRMVYSFVALHGFGLGHSVVFFMVLAKLSFSNSLVEHFRMSDFRYTGSF